MSKHIPKTYLLVADIQWTMALSQRMEWGEASSILFVIDELVHSNNTTMDSGKILSRCIYLHGTDYLKDLGHCDEAGGNVYKR